MTRPGRNEDCPCGSGKKYKRCCLGKEVAREDFSRALAGDALPLLRELGHYAAQRAGAQPESIARQRFPFWRPPLDRIRAARLLDYLIFDYRPATYGRAAVEEFLAERESIISPPWRELLRAWEGVGMRLFVFEQWSGGFARCRAAFPTGDRAIEVTPLERAEQNIPAKAPIALRALPVGRAFAYPAWPITFGARSAEDVIAAMQARHHDFVRRERIVSFEEFLRLEGTAFDEEAAVGSAASRIIVPGHS